jgi:hypothetical protein
MALGDALAVALLDARGFREEDFARSHPGGSLGRKLLIHVRDLMRSGDEVPRVGPQTSFTDMLREMTGKGLGFTAVADPQGRVLGIFTDGDLRRLIEKGGDGMAYQIAEVFGYREEDDRAFEWLEKAFALRDPGLAHTLADTLFSKRMREDPRWLPFITKMGFS